nr:DUF2066 domain-containing protein [Marinibactrum halimedae]
MAVPVKDLYQADIAVNDRGTQTRQQATAEALRRVLIKVAGRDDILAQPAANEALRRASSYLQEYSYRDIDSQTHLSVRFSPEAVRRLFQNSGLPMWPANRPQVLVWLVMNDYQTGKQLVMPNTEAQGGNGAPSVSASGSLNTNNGGQVSPNFYGLLQDAAAHRALPMTLPLMDLEDQLRLDANALWSLEESAILSASDRYNADAILVGRVTQTSRGEWRVGWWLNHNSRFEVFDSQSMQFDRAINDGIKGITEYFSGIYAVVSSPMTSEALHIQVSGVDRFGEYVGVIEYLRGLAVVSQAQLQVIREDSLLITLALNGDVAVLEDAMSLDKRMEAVRRLGVTNSVAPVGSGENPMQFRWIHRGIDQNKGKNGSEDQPEPKRRTYDPVIPVGE